MIYGKSASIVIMDEVPYLDLHFSDWHKCFDCGYEGDFGSSIPKPDMPYIPTEARARCVKCGQCNTDIIAVPEGVLLVDHGEKL